MSFLLLLLLTNTVITAAVLENKLDHYIIACHTTDFECFKRQYLALRDHVLLGNKFLGIAFQEPFTFQYGDSETCVQLTGFENSELTGISFDSNNREYSIVLQMLLNINQVRRELNKCVEPDKEFVNPIPPQNKSGPMMRFTGNATMRVTYPYTLQKKNGEVYLQLEEEDIDLALDIPDLSHFDTSSEVESKLYTWSEWAYEVVQHVDAAQRFAVPYTTKMRPVMERIPLKMLILLYPEENYTRLQFSYSKE